MQGLSATILLLTLATFLDELLDLARVLSSEHTSKPHLLHRKYHSSILPPRPHIPRWWPIPAAAGSPVTQSEPQTRHIISQGEKDANGRSQNGDVHTTQTRWALEVQDQYPQLELQRPLELEEQEIEGVIGSNAPMGWADPRLRGGQMLDVGTSPSILLTLYIPHHKIHLLNLYACHPYTATSTLTLTQFVFPGLGEPLNVIISGLSDPYILNPRGLLHYAQTLGFSTECLGIHLGMLHVANLGDALNPTPNLPSHDHDRNKDEEPTPPRIPPPNTDGNKTELLMARQNYDWPQYGWPDFGTCFEGLIGGNHFRAWKQDGAGARTGAWFLAASREMWLGTGHAISPDGYNGGRDGIVKRALKPTRWSPTEEGIWWKTTLKYNETLIPQGNKGMNYKIFQDGRVAILTVRRREKPPSRRELWDAWGELAQMPVEGSWFGADGGGWFDWERKADVRRARWELEAAEE